MRDTDQLYTQMFNERGEFLGVFLSVEAWNAVSEAVLSVLSGKAPSPRLREKTEPMRDWELLKQYWDFKYPVNTEVECTQCGARTEDWEKDDPRKFILRAANIGGQVRFQCCNCLADIHKKHFKDEICVECRPYDPDGC